MRMIDQLLVHFERPRIIDHAGVDSYGETVRMSYITYKFTNNRRVCMMTRLIPTSLALALSILPSYGQDSVTTDRSGYTTGIVGNGIQNTYTDQYGNTQGWIGGKYTSTYSDGYGGTTGTIGNKRVNTYEDGYGRTTGTIGRNQVNIYTDPSGHTTGTIGRRRLNCYTAGRTTTCN
jgi:hypothetical protein